jgi:hypothetical protein
MASAAFKAVELMKKSIAALINSIENERHRLLMK